VCEVEDVLIPNSYIPAGDLMFMHFQMNSLSRARTDDARKQILKLINWKDVSKLSKDSVIRVELEAYRLMLL